MDRPVRVGVVGAGNIVQRLHLPILRQLEGVELAAIAEANPERLRECVATFGIGRGHTDYREMLDGGGLDADLVAAPNALHELVTIAALESGCHVLVEKPMATSGDEAARMVAVARARDRILTINLPRRFSAYYRACADRLLHPASFSSSPVERVPGGDPGRSKRPAQALQRPCAGAAGVAARGVRG